jgi:septum formation protein
LSLPPLVLASASPRRRKLLLAAGLTCTVEPAQVDELDDAKVGLAGLVLANARAKALSVAGTRPGDIVVGADTLVWLDGRPLGKPMDTDSARRMLGELSGRVHEVATGVHLVRLEPRVQVEFHEVTRVRFRQLDAEIITEYLRRVDVRDKAGAYALQEHGEMLVESVEGSRSNVVGLPVERVTAALERHFGG